MEFKGYVDNGWIKPVQPTGLPDGTPVTITPQNPGRKKGGTRRRLSSKRANSTAISKPVPRLFKGLKWVAVVIVNRGPTIVAAANGCRVRHWRLSVSSVVGG